MIQPLTSDGRIVRLNLRPYKAAGGQKAPLLKAFVESAKEFKPSKPMFELEWGLLKDRLTQESLGKINLKDWQAIDLETRPLEFPAVDHSPEFEVATKPAYRVLTGEKANALVNSLPSRST